jgi:Na+/H+ antiporter NhaD/arsenite permease-like protein
LERIDYNILLYLIGIFVLAAGLEYTGVMDYFGDKLSDFSSNDAFTSTIMLLWVSAYLSATVDNIPITKVILPMTPSIAEAFSTSETKQLYYGFSIGVNWGDNLSPLGDNILVMNLSETHNSPISIKDFFKLGFITTNFQLLLTTLFFTLKLKPMMFPIMLTILVVMIIVIILIRRFMQVKKKIN